MSGLRDRLARPALLLQRGWLRLRPLPVGAFRVLIFHDIAAHQRDAFARFARWAAEDPGVITPQDAARRLDGSWLVPGIEEGRQPLLFTFDDGFVSNAEVAREVLEPLGIKAIFFVCPGLVDLAGDEQREAVRANVFRGRIAELPDALRLMRWDEIRGLAAAGHAIGSHGLTHQRLVPLLAGEIEAEVTQAADRLETELGAPAPWFAFTFGDIGSVSHEALAVAASRHRYCRSGVRGLMRPGIHRLAVRADHVDLDATDDYRRFAAEGGLDLRYRDARRRLDAMAAGL